MKTARMPKNIKILEKETYHGKHNYTNIRNEKQFVQSAKNIKIHEHSADQARIRKKSQHVPG